MTRLFDFEVPSHFIAQQPLDVRDQSRLMHLTRGKSAPAHRSFAELPGLLPRDALLVLNDTKVLPNRMVGTLPSGKTLEALLLHEQSAGLWEAMLRPGRRVRVGMHLPFFDNALSARAEAKTGDGHWILRFENPGAVRSTLERHGLAPLPPYIRRDLEPAAPPLTAADRRHYQTIYARNPGAVAAPTAGLHFTQRVFDGLTERGIERTALTLHVGLGTFKPITVEDPAQHKMHAEQVSIGASPAASIKAAHASGRAVIAVGTTTVRALESWAAVGMPAEYHDNTDLYIRHPYRFRVVDGIITNFHQPRSTLILMIAAFHGEQALLRAYRDAMSGGYRFFSYGDCMAVLPA